MKKYIISSVLTAGLVVSMFTGCGKASGGSASGKSSIAAMQKNSDGTYTVTVAVLDGMAPYTYTDKDGKMQGYDFEWMKAVDEKLKKYKFKYVSVGADAAPAAIQAGTYAFSASAHFVTPARAQQFILSVPESYYPVNLISRKADSFKKFEDLDGKSLVPNPPNDGLSVVLKQMAAKYPNVKYTQDPTSEYIPYEDGLKGVISGKYDCWFGGKAMYDDIVKNNKSEADATYCSDPITCAPCVAVINKNLTDLRDAINTATCELYKDGTLQKLSKKWLNDDVFATAKNTKTLFDYSGYSKDKANWYQSTLK
ncbi:MAG: hypothetical protein DUD27_08350 [Lachnospiraceae bacterium]|uniref:Transporter substrate-binding domain-containing protein n=1 Tax=Candidatus Weimeria bifida TaxID=2599074 RepID=A0A6N7IYI3_9FIRM|nr:transporter substrate-binding domain-containing protein [Candidatus Weimeria bifida]RRF95208.1 MAG: hypothetical protein DUD27_08350 [Lachnospiraceae bacterium]